MKTRFSCHLTGRDWWKPFLVFFAVLVFLNLQMQDASSKITLATKGRELTSIILYYFVIYALFILVQAASLIILSSRALPKIVLGDTCSSFHGKMLPYLGINIKGFLLTLITLGLYYPWYSRSLLAYYYSSVTIQDAPLIFTGTAKKLFKYFIFGLLLPLLVWSIAFGLTFGMAILSYTTTGEIDTSHVFLTILLFFSLFPLLAPFLYLSLRWSLSVQWKSRTLVINITFWDGLFFFIKQIFLACITLAIYLPAVYINTYRFFASQSTLAEEGQESIVIGFDGTNREGFGFIWKQILLSLITCGIYFPWAYAKILCFFINGTWLDEKSSDTTALEA